ncbi:MAG: anaerobic ribonucleoside-triphosphate reductase activating protein, partial [Candidatus Undinarchaeales archaeon]|nr:anaerobic ribonucleoside-triphosphate reductase activating protein [Candidatus Undinarchaeales archaeon]
FAFIEKHNDFIDGVCITGGEPTLSSGLVDFCQKLKGKDFLVKLDTNGTNPEVLKTLIDSKLVDFVAMDIKGPWENYGDFIGVPFNAEQLKESVKLIMDSGIDYEFRTTIVPELHTLEVFEKLVAQVSGAKKFCIQKFRSGMCLDPKFNEKKPQTDDEMKPFVEIAEKHATVVKMRGK